MAGDDLEAGDALLAGAIEHAESDGYGSVRYSPVRCGRALVLRLSGLRFGHGIAQHDFDVWQLAGLEHRELGDAEVARSDHAVEPQRFFCQRLVALRED